MFLLTLSTEAYISLLFFFFFPTLFHSLKHVNCSVLEYFKSLIHELQRLDSVNLTGGKKKTQEKGYDLEVRFMF